MALSMSTVGPVQSTVQSDVTFILQKTLPIVQSGWSGCRTGNREKLSSSQEQLGQATYLDVAQFLSVSCATSTPSTLYSLCSMTINGDMELTTRVK